MSKHRIKSVGLDDVDFDDYDQSYEENAEEGLSTEDKEQLRIGTIDVREALGPDSPATDQQIQDTLWHYFYDVSKSVAYLKNQQTPSIPKGKKKKDGKPQDISEMVLMRREKSAVITLCTESCSAKEFFKDFSWTSIPKHRRAEILVEPLYPPGGLLGGSAQGGKMSKLAALAAKRRQKESENPVSPKVEGSSEVDSYASGLRSLRISSLAPSKSTISAVASPRQYSEKMPSTAPASETEQPGATDQAQEIETGLQFAAGEITAQPSPFASTIIGKTVSPSARLFPSAVENPSNEIYTAGFDFSEPSPDDVITRAQTAKVQPASKTQPPVKETKKTRTSLTNGVDNLSLQEPVKIKSKNIDVVAEHKKRKRKNAASFVVIGHVDAGKSTLMGRLLFDLKAVDQRTMDKYKKEADQIGKGSFAFAWVLDQGSEERARGVTIDVATSNFETEKTNYTILDAPGHRDFVPNMIAGASQADFAVLVIDASPGNFESGLKGQTKEHVILVRSIGVQRIIVVVNKMDAADWSQDRFQEIQQQMAAFLITAGFQRKNVAFVPCSGLRGDNILSKSQDPRFSWYNGLSLVEELDMSEPSAHALDKPLRLTIGDVFRGGVQNPLSVSGRLEAGTIQTGEQVVVMPSGEKAYIKSIEVEDEPQEWAVAGQNVVINLTDIDQIHLKTGDVLCSTVSAIQNVTQFTAKVLAIEYLTPMSVDVHRGFLHVPGRISQLVATLDKASGVVVKKRPKIVQPGSVVRVVVMLEEAVPLEAPARVVFRSGGETVGAGLIE